MSTVHLIISGSVQGIGFRSWIKHQAKDLSVTGWVKNREDGAVESIVQGDTHAIEELVRRVHLGPPLAHVTAVEKELIENALQYDDFIVIQ